MINCGTLPRYHLTLARRCRHVSQARDVYFLTGRLRLAGSSGAAGIANYAQKQVELLLSSRLQCYILNIGTLQLFGTESMDFRRLPLKLDITKHPFHTLLPQALRQQFLIFRLQYLIITD